MSGDGSDDVVAGCLEEDGGRGRIREIVKKE